MCSDSPKLCDLSIKRVMTASDIVIITSILLLLLGTDRATSIVVVAIVDEIGVSGSSSD